MKIALLIAGLSIFALWTWAGLAGMNDEACKPEDSHDH